jgi:DNA polymerase I-like protein with 3'-5' exonuclease and polymerase domains
MTKQAMVNIYETGKTPLIQIHDEIAISVKNIDEAKKYSTIMETAVPLIIPNKCDIEIGNSWGEAE